jgi:RecB family endonuclease NucS
MRKVTRAKNRENPVHSKLQAALRANIKRLEAGLKITDGGKEQIVKYGGTANPGRIDITAKDRKGATVVIEVKSGKVGRRAIGQILGYMGALMRLLREKRIRGFLVAKEFSPQGKAAARPVPTLKLRKFSDLPSKLLTPAR